MKTKDIGLAIKDRRRFLKVDQRTLAELSGVAVHTISDIESGKGNPTVESLTRIGAVLGMTLKFMVAHEP